LCKIIKDIEERVTEENVLNAKFECVDSDLGKAEDLEFAVCL
jgi:hypothetical protein